MKNITIAELFNLFPDTDEEDVYCNIYRKDIQLFNGMPHDIPKTLKNKIIKEMYISYEAEINIFI